RLDKDIVQVADVVAAHAKRVEQQVRVDGQDRAWAGEVRAAEREVHGQGRTIETHVVGLGGVVQEQFDAVDGGAGIAADHARIRAGGDREDAAARREVNAAREAREARAEGRELPGALRRAAGQ